jgi:hypothetical protein
MAVRLRLISQVMLFCYERKTLSEPITLIKYLSLLICIEREKHSWLVGVVPGQRGRGVRGDEYVLDEPALLSRRSSRQRAFSMKLTQVCSMVGSLRGHPGPPVSEQRKHT